MFIVAIATVAYLLWALRLGGTLAFALDVISLSCHDKRNLRDKYHGCESVFARMLIVLARTRSLSTIVMRCARTT